MRLPESSRNIPRGHRRKDARPYYREKRDLFRKRFHFLKKSNLPLRACKQIWFRLNCGDIFGTLFTTIIMFTALTGVGGQRRRGVGLPGFAVIKQHAAVRTTADRGVTTGRLNVLCAFYYGGIHITCYWTLWYGQENYILFLHNGRSSSGTRYKYTCVSYRALYTRRPLSPSIPWYMMDHPVTAHSTKVV